MPIPPKTLTGASASDAGSSTQTGGLDWNDLGTHLGNMNKEPYTWYIYKDGSNYKAKNGNTGVVSYSNTDCKTVFQAVLDTIPVFDDTVRTLIRVAPGDYDITSQISGFYKHNLAIVGSGMGITRFRAHGSVAEMLKFEGNYLTNTNKNLTANCGGGSTTCTVSSGDAATFASGDWVVLASTAPWNGGSATFATAAKQGELKQIASVSGTTVTFREPTFDTYNTADTAYIKKILMMKNFTFGNFTICRSPTYTPPTDPHWFMMKYIDRALVDRIELVDPVGVYGAGCIYVNSCVATKISNCHMQMNVPFNFQYGIAIWEASQGVVVSNCTSQGDWRHPFETGVSASGFYPGVPRNILFTGCTATGGLHAQFDTHPDGEGIQFVNCGVMGTNGGAGFKLRTKRSAIIGCYIERAGPSDTGAIRIADFANDCMIANNHIVNCNTHGIQIHNGCDRTMIFGNRIDNCNGNGIDIQGSSAEQGTSFGTQINNNVIVNNNLDGISCIDSDNMIITGNFIRGNSAYGLDFTAGDCQNNVIANNSFSNNTSGSVRNGGQTGNKESNNFGYP